jgi:hypothetical protein
MTLPVLACVAGIYLGLNFRFLAVLPFSAAGAGAYVLLLSSSGQSLSDCAWNLTIMTIAVQAGYMLGLTARDLYRQVVDRLGLVQSQRR